MQADYNLRWAHIPEGLFTYLVTHFVSDKNTDIYNQYAMCVATSLTKREQEHE